MSTTPPGAGWYPDASTPGQLRYWDGSRWTENVHRVAPSPEPAGAPDGPQRPRRTGLIATLISVGVVVVLGVVTAVAWGPVSALLFPKYTLAETSDYKRSVEYLRDTFSDRAESPLDYPGNDMSWRQSVAYTTAALQYIEEYIDEYGAKEMVFDSKSEADTYAYENTTWEFMDLTSRLRAGGIGTPLATQSFPLAPELVAIEEQIAAMPVEPGADGTYWDAGQAIADLVGAELTTDLSLNACFGLDRGAAYFCSMEPNWGQIFIDTAMEYVDQPRFVQTVKHEIAHKLMHTQCQGSWNSPYNGAAWTVEYGEGATNSYAVLFLGADREELSSRGEYAMSERTDAKAQAIHDGDLACFDDETPPPPVEN